MGRASPGLSSRWETLVLASAGGADGRTCTSAGTINTKGTWVTDTTWKPTFTWNLMQVTLLNASAGDYTVDIGIDDGSGNVYVICPDLRCPGLRVARAGMVHYMLPLHVEQGKQLAFRCAASVVSLQCRVTIGGGAIGMGGSMGFGRMVALYSPSSSRGVAVDPGGTVDTKGSWAQLTSSSSDRVVAVVGCIGHNNDIARAANQSMLLDIGIGAASSERVLIPDLHFTAETNQDQWLPSTFGPYPCDVPSGTRFAARSACSVNTAGDRTCDIALWGFVA